MGELEIIKAVGGMGTAAGTLCVAIILAKKLDAASERIMTVLTTVVSENTRMLAEFKKVIESCRHGRESKRNE